jgi:sulfite dehydrogenase (quinone) subunit SoeC
MHPAYSVILFTTASGAGYGLLMWLAITALAHGHASDWRFAVASSLVALALVTFGLIASTFHLGRPERAWRAFSEWRSSWLSREGIASLTTYVPALLFSFTWSGLLPHIQSLAFLALATLLMCVVTVYCTAKIYSSLLTIRQWRHPLVESGYLLWALATGSVLLALLSSIFGLNAPVLGRVSALSLIAAALCKGFYWRAIDTLPAVFSIEQATGLGRLGRVRQWEAPHTAENFVMREMGYRVARRHAAKLRRYVLAAAFLAAALVLASGITSGPLAVLFATLATTASAFAVLVERWLFFAEAQHVSTLYYGAPVA